MTNLDEIYREVVANGNRLTALEKTQELQHIENHNDIEEIKKDVKGLPTMKAKLNVHGTIIFILLSSLIALAYKSFQ